MPGRTWKSVLPPAAPCLPVGWIDARVIGLRENPLSAYADLAARYYPFGVPIDEADFALDLLRARRARDVLSADCATGDIVPLELPGILLPPPPAPEADAALRGIMVEAVPVSTRGLADWDALAVTIRSADGSGLRGTLHATLWGQSQTLVPLYQEQFVARPGRFEQLATWTRALDTDEPIAWEVLPLPRPLPEHDLSVAPFGELHVRLLVPGTGTFDASAPFVALRRLTPLRDRNLVETRSRFFPTERTHDARMPGGLSFRQTTTLTGRRRTR